jgi:hypothetical protein
MHVFVPVQLKNYFRTPGKRPVSKSDDQLIRRQLAFRARPCWQSGGTQEQVKRIRRGQSVFLV